MAPIGSSTRINTFVNPWLTALLVVSLVASCAPSQSEEESQLSPDELEALREEAKGDGLSCLLPYQSEYINLGLAGTCEQGDVALVAGTHSLNFPYFESEPWDNGLLLIGQEGYHFTQRQQGQYLTIAVDPELPNQNGRIQYQGPMVRASDGQEVMVALDLPVAAFRFKARQLGKPYKLFNDIVSGIGLCEGLDLDWVIGMRWQPFQLASTSEAGTITIGETQVRVEGINGELENGRTTNLRGEAFAFSYDYVAVAKPGSEGYGFVDFKSHALDPSGIIGGAIDLYAQTTASESVTLTENEDIAGNLFDVRRPSQSDASVVLFENRVDLGLATLQRQMIKTSDPTGAALYGLREIFTKK